MHSMRSVDPKTIPFLQPGQMPRCSLPVRITPWLTSAYLPRRRLPIPRDFFLSLLWLYQALYASVIVVNSCLNISACQLVTFSRTSRSAGTSHGTQGSHGKRVSPAPEPVTLGDKTGSSSSSGATPAPHTCGSTYMQASKNTCGNDCTLPSGDIRYANSQRLPASVPMCATSCSAAHSNGAVQAGLSKCLRGNLCSNQGLPLCHI